MPFRVLERVPKKGVLDSYGSDCGNVIIHGDNLAALKALLPEYEGRVDCVYMDPLYNTDEEKWADLAGQRYGYFMVFDEDPLNMNGAYSFPAFKTKILAQL